MGRNEKEEMRNTLDIVSELSDLALDRLLVCALLEKERRTWKMISELHPAEDAGQEAREIYLFLNAPEMRHTQAATYSIFYGILMVCVSADMVDIPA